MNGEALHLHTYFLFPFAVDQEVVMEDHPAVWGNCNFWIDGLDAWIAQHGEGVASPIAGKLGRWERAAYKRFDMESPAYQDMVFFHPFVRRVFFDTADSMKQAGEPESLLRCFRIPVGDTPGRKLFLEARDALGREARVEVTDLRLFLFANGIGILSLGCEAFHLSFQQALWINEMMRKVYPSSGRQLREGRTPRRVALVVEEDGKAEVLVEDAFPASVMRGFLPPLSKVISELLYFANYASQEYEPVLDERMIVYSYMTVDPATVPAGFSQSEDYEILFSRLLYVDRMGDEYRYDADFTREAMRQQVYRRWAHQGTLYGFTSYSNVTMAMGVFECDEHQLREGFLIHRMFTMRYYLTTIVALFYRATLLDFSERTALVTRQLFRKNEMSRITTDEIRMTGRLTTEFQHFSNYWYFSELANKDEEIEHFQMQCTAFRLEKMKNELESEVEKLSGTLERFYLLRSNEGVNRLAMLSMILGGGAMVTGYFGMNFGREFERVFFNPVENPWPHRMAVVAVSLVVLCSIVFGLFLVAANWQDYKAILLPRPWRKLAAPASLRRTETRDTEE